MKDNLFARKDDRRTGDSSTSSPIEKGPLQSRSGEVTEPAVHTGIGTFSAVISSTLLLRIASRTSFVILGFYLGEHFASAAIVALILEMFYLSELVIAPLTGSLSDRLGRRPFLLLAPILAGLSACCLLMVAWLFPHPPATFHTGLGLLLFLILLGRLLEGSASGMNVPATLGYITDRTTSSEQLRARVMTAFEMVTVGGIALAIPFGGKVSSIMGVWGLVVVIGLYIISLLIITFGTREKAPQQPESGSRHDSLTASLAVIRHRRIYTFLPAWFSVNALVGAWTTLVTIILAYPDPQADIRHPGQLLYGGFSQMSASLWVGSFALVFLAGMGLWMLFLARIRRTTVMLIGLGGLALTIAALSIINSLAEDPWAIPVSARPLMDLLIPLAMFGVLLLSGFTPVALTQMSAIAETLPGKRGAVMGLYSVVLAIGQLVGATIGGTCVDISGFYGLMVFSTIMGLCSLASVLYMRSHSHDLLSAKPKLTEKTGNLAL